MKRVQLLITISGLFFLLSCRQESILFRNPQPSIEKKILIFPKNLQGDYICSAMNLKLMIKETVAYLSQNNCIPILKTEFDTCSTCKIKGDSVFSTEDNFKGAFEIVGDSVFVSFTDTDTISLLSEKVILKKYKNNYFLSELVSDSLWRVEKVALTHENTLIISSIKKSEELELIRNIMPVHDIIDPTGLSDRYILNPSKEQFINMLDANTFTDTILFTRNNN